MVITFLMGHVMHLSSDASHARRSGPAGTGQAGPVRQAVVGDPTEAQH